LYYALLKLSNARKDRHLKVGQAEGGIKVPYTQYVEAPIKFAADYSNSRQPQLFLSDYTGFLKMVNGKIKAELGDQLIMINDQEVSDYVESLRPYYRYSTERNYWYQVSNTLNRRGNHLPSEFDVDQLKVTLMNKDGEKYSLKLSYDKPELIKWIGSDKPRYQDFELKFSKQTFDLYLPKDFMKKTILIQWHRFHTDLIKDINELVEFADSKGMLGWNIIFDATRGAGGSRGAYAIQRLSPKPFRTTFGNLRLSDITDDFIQHMKVSFEKKKILDGGARETIDDGSNVIEWLTNDVTKGMERGQEYSNNVPFKCAHLPKYSDGVIHPAKKGFTGKLVCLFGPHGGSHLDQFASIIIDNKLGHSIGMPCGGYSNTWEWTETLTFPGSDKPVVRFMWSIGHTIRPNGEILEGNPADVEEYIPMTKENFSTYYDILITQAFNWFESGE